MEDDRYIRITLRIPIELRSKLQASADLRSHSQNAEIIARLVQSYEEAPPLKPSDLPAGELIQELIDRYGPERVCIRIGDPEIGASKK